MSDVERRSFGTAKCSRRNMRARDPAQDKRGQDRARLDHEIPRHEQGTEGEDNIAWKTHPLPKQGRVVEFLAPGIGEPVFVDGVELWPAAREEIDHRPGDAEEA